MSGRGEKDPIARSLGSDFFGRVKYVAEKLIEHEGDIRVVTHNDSDGICAGGVIGQTLKRLDKSFHMSSVKGLNETLIEKIDEEENELTVILDMGSSHLDKLEKTAGRTLVIDHHAIASKGRKSVVLLNPHNYDRDGSREVSGSTMSFLVSQAISKDNWDLLGTALAGAMGDRQDIGGFTGINQLLLELGVEKGYLRVSRKMDIMDIPLERAIPASLDPFYKNYSVSPERCIEDLQRMGINHGKKPSDLNDDENTSLATLLSTELVRSGIRPESIELLKKVKIEDKKRFFEARRLSDMVNACGKMGERGIGLALAMGDTTYREKAVEIRNEYRDGIRKELQELSRKGTKVKGGIQYFWTEDKNRAGAVCGLGILYAVNQERPLFFLHEKRGDIKISARGTAYLVKKGLDLAKACRESALAASGQGGGHAIASGATVPKDNIEEFLQNAGRIVGEQLNLSAK